MYVDGVVLKELINDWGGCKQNGIVMDIFMGSGTVGLMAERLDRKWIGIELSKESCDIAIKRISEETNKPIKMNFFKKVC